MQPRTVTGLLSYSIQCRPPLYKNSLASVLTGHTVFSIKRSESAVKAKKHSDGQKRTAVTRGIPAVRSVSKRMHLSGLEPPHTAPEAVALSPELQMRDIYCTTDFKNEQALFLKT